jgi:Ca-activated chloride channel family protein
MRRPGIIPLTEDPALKTYLTPIKVDVNLVLVLVSMVDPLNRQVIGLDKENFQVFEGKERQEIRHFSSFRVRMLPFPSAPSST